METQEAWLGGLPPPVLLPPKLGPLLCCYLGFFLKPKSMRRGSQGDLHAFSCPKLRWTRASFHVIRLCRRADRPLGHPFLGVQSLETPPVCEELSRTLPCVLLAQGLSSRLPGFTSLSRHPSPYPPRLPLLLTTKLLALTFSRDNYCTN